MDNPGTHDLGTYTITSAVTNLVITEGVSDAGAAQAFLDGLDDMKSATLDVNFVYGSGGTTAILTVETSLNQGTTWIEVARFSFTTASAEKVLNLAAATEILAAYTPAALSSDAGKGGIFGDRWRARLTTTGTYAGNTSIAARLNARG